MTEKQKGGGCVVPLLLLFGLFLFAAGLMSNGDGRRSPSNRRSPPSMDSPTGLPSTGDVLRRQGGAFVTVSVSQEVEDRLMKLVTAGDVYGVNDLMKVGLVYTVPNDTKVLVVDRGFFTSEVRIQSGSHAGEYGFVSTERID